MATNGLQKLAGDLPGVMQTAAHQLVKMANDLATLQVAYQKMEHELAAMKLARRMEQRGVMPEYDFEQKVAKLLETPAEKLATLDQAVELATTGFRLGSVPVEDKTASEDRAAPTSDALDQWILSNAAYN